MEIIRERFQALAQKVALEIRGDGRAGSGLMLTLQCVARTAIANPELHVQEWPFFSASRKGAPTRGFLRLSRHPILKASEITRPHLVLATDTAIFSMVDCTQGVSEDGAFLINTSLKPSDAGKKFKLSGHIVTIDGDGLSEKFLKKPIGNISLFALLTQILPGFTPAKGKESLENLLTKRRLPKTLIQANLDLFEESLGKGETAAGNFAKEKTSSPKPFAGYGALTAGAQSSLRLSRSVKTSAYAKSGYRLHFYDPQKLCNGCAYCIVNCPENIIRFVPDDERGVLVLGADVNNYCKLCRECIHICPKNLFSEVPL